MTRAVSAATAAYSCQPERATTMAPFGTSGERLSITSPTVCAGMMSPTCIGGW
jgi:hypothetical protein